MAGSDVPRGDVDAGLSAALDVRLQPRSQLQNGGRSLCRLLEQHQSQVRKEDGALLAPAQSLRGLAPAALSGSGASFKGALRGNGQTASLSDAPSGFAVSNTRKWVSRRGGTLVCKKESKLFLIAVSPGSSKKALPWTSLLLVIHIASVTTPANFPLMTYLYGRQKKSLTRSSVTCR